MNALIYMGESDCNEATSYYLAIITKAVENATGSNVKCVNSWREIKKNDFVIILTYKHFFYTYYFAKCKNIIFWFQGILPEELVLSGKDIKSRLKYLFYTVLEKVILKKSKFIFFVSEAMRLHFYHKCSYQNNNYMIMPCFNKTLRKESFYYPNKYIKPTFVYTGSLSAWQCINEMLDLYKQIEDRIKNSKLIFLTQETNKAEDMILQKGIKNVEVNFIPLGKLDDELQKYKYAFLIRDNIAVNRVATPTKMNTYLANGLIPIYSDTIDSFKDYFKSEDYFVRISGKSITPDILTSIIEIEKQDIEPDYILDKYENIFISYYDENKYQKKIEEIMRNIFRVNHQKL